MSIWKKQLVDTATKKAQKRGITRLRNMYTKDKKMVAKNVIPANVFQLLQTHDEVDDTNLVLEAPWRECIFCGEQAMKSRLVQLQTVYLCDTHYYSENIGRIAQRLRELKEGVTNAESQGERVPVLSEREESSQSLRQENEAQSQVTV